MKFKDLIGAYTWLEIRSTLEQVYPNDGNDIPAYEEVFAKLQQMEPQPTDLRLVIEEIDDSLEQTTIPSVVGANDLHSYAIEFMKWEQWLGMEVDRETLQRYSGREVIAYSLWEMSFFGYSQEAIQAWVDEHKQRKNDEPRITIDELRRELGIDEKD